MLKKFCLLVLLMKTAIFYTFALETTYETRGIMSYVKDKGGAIYNKVSEKVVSIMEKQLLYLAGKIEDTCESEIKDGRIVATEYGKSSCLKRCKGLPKRIQNALLTVSNKFPATFGNGNLFTIISAEDDTHLPEYECLPNIGNDKLLCDCPRAPRFYVSEKAQKELEHLLAGQYNTRELVLGGILILILAVCFTPVWVPILLITSPIWFPLIAGLMAFG